MDHATHMQIAKALGIGKRAVEMRARKERWTFLECAVRGGRERRYALDKLPEPVRAALIMKYALPDQALTDGAGEPEKYARSKRRWSTAAIEAAWDKYGRSPDNVKAIARDRLDIIDGVRRLTASGVSKMRALELAEQQSGVARATIYRWYKRVGAAPRAYWAALLLPSWAGRAGNSAEIPERAWDLFKADYLRLEAPCLSACFARIEQIAKREGWALPSERTFARRIRVIPRQVRILARHGVEALLRTYPAQERDKSYMRALEAVNADGHKFDVFVRWEDGEVSRPVMVAFQDLHAGKILSYRTDRSESQHLVRLAYADMVTDHGIPEMAYLDNGRSFAAKMISGGAPTRYRFKVREEDPVGVLKLLGTEPRWTTPYHGQSKPIERAFRDLCETVAKHPAFAGAYTGNKPDAKPGNYGQHAVPVETFLQVLDVEIQRHNERTGRESKVCSGRSFDQVFAESYRTNQHVIRKPTAEQHRLLWLAAEAITADSRDGACRLAGYRYWTEELVAYAGQKLVLRIDPDARDTLAYAYTLSGDFIASAPCVAAVSYIDQSASAGHAKARGDYARAAKRMLAAERRLHAYDVAEELLGKDVAPAPRQRERATVHALPPKPPERIGLTERERALDDYLKELQHKRAAEQF